MELYQEDSTGDNESDSVATATKDAESVDSNADGKTSGDSSVEKVLDSLKSDDGKSTDQKHNFDAGLMKVQERISDLSNKLEANVKQQKELQDLISGSIGKGSVDDDELELLSELSDDDFMDAKTFKQVVKQQKKNQNALLSEISELKKSIAGTKSTANLTPDQVVNQVQQMFPDLDKQYVTHIIEKASPLMESFDREHPDADESFRTFAAQRFLNEQAQIVKNQVDIQTGGSRKGKAVKSSAGTKIVDNSASSATASKGGNRPILSMQDALDKWLDHPG